MEDVGSAAMMSMIAWGSSCANGCDANSNPAKHQMEWAAGDGAADVWVANTCVRPDIAHGW